MLVLDSDILSIIQRASGAEYDRLAAKLDAADDDVYVTVISLEEQMRGWLAYIAREQSFEKQTLAYLKLRELVVDFAARAMLDFDATSANEVTRLKKLKVRIGTMDLKIAAIVLAHNAKLITRNLIDFRKVPGLVAEDWAR
ncbi:MAG: PilT protein domain protein [Phycisphaerales bacterium]|nr:PilT protein domain protein [Phycisphaerales bacterium]